MVNKRWSDKAYQSLKDIIKFHDKNPVYGRRLAKEIFNLVDKLEYSKQYQEDEILGSPFRRIIIKQYRIVYKVVSPEDIHILQIFHSKQSSENIKREFKQ